METRRGGSLGAAMVSHVCSRGGIEVSVESMEVSEAMAPPKGTNGQCADAERR
jgi:hypothetical protein